MEHIGSILNRVLGGANMPASSDIASSTPEVCVWCDGTGVTWGRDDGSDGDFVPVACACHAGDPLRVLNWRQIEALRRIETVLARPAWARFRAARLDDFGVGIHTAVSSALDGGRGLWLYGLPGRGKSHLGVATIRELAYRGRKPELVNIAIWLGEIRRAFGAEHDDVDADEITMAPSGWPALLLDDLGAQRVTPWAAERIYMLVERRWQGAAVGQVTVVTSNLPPPEVEAQFVDHLQGSRIVSRLLGCCDALELVGVDRRLPAPHGGKP